MPGRAVSVADRPGLVRPVGCGAFGLAGRAKPLEMAPGRIFWPGRVTGARRFLVVTSFVSRKHISESWFAQHASTSWLCLVQRNPEHDFVYIATDFERTLDDVDVRASGFDNKDKRVDQMRRGANIGKRGHGWQIDNDVFVGVAKSLK